VSDELLIWLIMFAIGIILALTFLFALNTAEEVLTALRAGDWPTAILNFIILASIFAVTTYAALLLLVEAEIREPPC